MLSLVTQRSTSLSLRSSLRAIPVGLRGFATSNDELDLVVVGGGPGGYVAAIKAAQLGLKTACVESRGKLGGTCLNVGCIPSKALLNNSHLYHLAKHDFSKRGIKVNGVELDLPALLKSKEKAVDGLTQGIEHLFRKNKVQYVKGFGKIQPRQVDVDLLDGSKTTLKTKNIIVATGSEPTPFPGIQVDQKSIVDSTGALSLSNVPKKLVVIGGGIIGLELGSVWSRLGAEVTVVEFMNAIGGAGMDGQASKTIQTSLSKQGLKFKLSTKVLGITKEGNTQKVNVQGAQGGAQEQLDADVVLVAIGRRPFTSGTGLKDIGVQFDERGRIKVDENFKTNVDGIYAIGDVIHGPMLAHKAEEDGIACVETLAGGHGHVNYATVPSVLYTHPEVAWVGKSEEELKASNVQYNAGMFPFQANSRARTNDDSEGFVKILSDAKTDRILGIHIVGSAAGEMIAEGVLALEYGASSEDVARTSHAHPTLSEAFKEAAMMAHGLKKAIHF